MKIKKGDNVIVTTGKSRNKSGKVLVAIPTENRIVVEGVNIVKRHIKARRQGEKGQIVEKPAPINASNVMLVCSACSKPARIKMRIEGKDKYRVCSKCGKDMASSS